MPAVSIVVEGQHRGTGWIVPNSMTEKAADHLRVFRQLDVIPYSTGHLFYWWSIVSARGIEVLLFVDPWVTHQQVKEAKRNLRNSRDIVGIEVFNVTEWKAPHDMPKV